MNTATHDAGTARNARGGAIDFDGAALIDFLFDTSTHGGPRLSAYSPMIRVGDTAQNPTRFKNLLREAREKLTAAGLEQRAIAALTDGIEQRMAGRDVWEHQDDGLAIFAEPGRSMSIKCPANLTHQIVVGDSYHVLPLLGLLGEPPRFSVLAVSKNRVRLIDGCRDDGTEATHAIDALPRRLSDVEGSVVERDSLQHHSPQRDSAAIFHGQGAGDDDELPELERYCKTIAEGAAAELGPKRRVVLAGEVRLRSIFRRVAEGLNLAAADIDGNHDTTPDGELAARGWEIVLAASRARESQLAEQFHREIGNDRASDAEITIYEAAERGRIALLLVDSALAASADRDSAQQSRAVNQAVLATLQHGGGVRAVDSSRMPTDASLAALFRY